MRLDAGRILAVAAGLIALATVLGAFGAHALREELSADRLSVYLSANRYQFFHSLGLLGIGLAARNVDAALLNWAARLVLAGIILFCGSLYALAFGAPNSIGIVTPVGGVLLIAGWVLLATAMWRTRGR
jgi:uncharacterized membrane protein YgdD (TMEM256/DUF423 family)